MILYTHNHNTHSYNTSHITAYKYKPTLYYMHVVLYNILLIVNNTLTYTLINWHIHTHTHMYA